MKIEVLGPGCQKCQSLASNTETAVRELGLDCRIEKVTDISEISARGVMMTPALLVGGQVKVIGRVPSVEEIKAMIS